jgi:hypothetical protein
LQNLPAAVELNEAKLNHADTRSAVTGLFLMTWWLVLVLLESMLLAHRFACIDATAVPQTTWAAAAKAATAPPAAALGFRSTKAGLACSARQEVAQAVLNAVAHPPVSAGHQQSMHLPSKIMDSNCSCLPVTCTEHVHIINPFLTVQPAGIQRLQR